MDIPVINLDIYEGIEDLKREAQGEEEEDDALAVEGAMREDDALAVEGAMRAMFGGERPHKETVKRLLEKVMKVMKAEVVEVEDILKKGSFPVFPRVSGVTCVMKGFFLVCISTKDPGGLAASRTLEVICASCTFTMSVLHATSYHEVSGPRNKCTNPPDEFQCWNNHGVKNQVSIPPILIQYTIRRKYPKSSGHVPVGMSEGVQKDSWC